jgi:hypothetical protein
MKTSMRLMTTAVLACMATGALAQGPVVDMTGNVWMVGEQPPAPPPLPSPAPAHIITGDAAIYYESLRPFGSWFQVTPFGHVWRPTVVVSNPEWRPYVDSGSWILVNNSWYWQSHYSWGWAPFHYGRWMKSSVLGWVWIPGTEWSGAWVTWRETPTHYEWAPMPAESRVSISIGSTHGNVDWGFQFTITDGHFVSAPRYHFAGGSYWSSHHYHHSHHVVTHKSVYHEQPQQVTVTHQNAPTRRTTKVQNVVTSPGTSTASSTTRSSTQKASVTKTTTAPATSRPSNENRRPSRVQDIMIRSRK